MHGDRSVLCVLQCYLMTGNNRVECSPPELSAVLIVSPYSNCLHTHTKGENHKEGKFITNILQQEKLMTGRCLEWQETGRVYREWAKCVSISSLLVSYSCHGSHPPSIHEAR